MIDKESKISIRRQCELLGINRVGLYVKPKGESAQNLQIMRLIDGHFLQYPTKGVLQMQDFLTEQGYRVNHKRLRRLLRKIRIVPIYPKRKLSKLGKAKYIKPYLLGNRKIGYPNQVWAIDISYVPMKKGFMYLTVVIDWYSRYIVGWQLSNTLEADTQTQLMEALIETHGKPQVINSDQGSQYTCCGWIDLMNKQGIQISMGGSGRATDNAVVERFFRTVKQEYLYLNPLEKVCELRQGLSAFIDYYDTQCTHQGIGRVQAHKKYFMAA